MQDVYTTITAAEDVTDEVMDAARSVVDGWYAADDRIDWEDVWERLDGTELDNGTKIDMGNSLISPAIDLIKKRIRAERRAG